MTSRNSVYLVAGGFLAALFLAGAAHAITDTVFKYSTPKTGYYGLSPSAFAPFDNFDADGYNNSFPDYLSLFNSNTQGCFTTGVNLPHGAAISAFTMWYESDQQQSVQLLLYRSKVADGTSDQIAQLLSSDTSQTRKAKNAALSSSAVVTVDNRDYVYSVGLCLQSAGSKYFAGRITYTYTNAGD